MVLRAFGVDMTPQGRLFKFEVRKMLYTVLYYIIYYILYTTAKKSSKGHKWGILGRFLRFPKS